MSTFPYIQLSNVFNPDDFTAADSSLTITLGDERYVRIGSFAILAALNVSGNIDAGSLTINGSPIDIPSLEYVTDITPGTVSASKALVVDANKDINSVRNMSVEGTFTILEGGSVDFQSSSTINYSGNGTHLIFSGANSYLSMTGANTRIQMDSVNSYISLANTAKSTNANTGCIRAAGGIYVGEDSIFAMDLNLSGHNGTSTGLHLGGTLVTATASELNYVDVAPGIASASKALVLDSSSNITGINSLSTNSVNINAGNLRLDDGYGIYFDRVIGTDVNSSITCDSTANMTFDSSRGNGNFKFKSNGLGNQIFSLNDLNNTNHTFVAFANKVGINKFNGITALSYELDVGGSINASSYYNGGSLMLSSALTGVTAGTAAASKALVIDSSSNINGINNLSSTYLSAVDYLQSSGTSQPSLTESSPKSEYRLILSHNTAFNGFNLGIAFDCNTETANAYTPGAAIVYRRTSSWGVGDLLFQTKGITSTSADCTERMRILSNGNVGIGTSSTSYKLDVNGSINANSYYLDGSLLSFTSSSVVTANTIVRADSDSNITFNASTDSGVSNSLSFGTGGSPSTIYFDNLTNNKLTFDTSLGFALRTRFVGIASNSYEYWSVNIDSPIYGDKKLSIRCRHDSDLVSFGTTGASALFISPNNTDTVSTRALRLTTSNLAYNTANVTSGFDVDFNCSNMRIRAPNLCIGDSTDTTRLISALDASQSIGTTKYITLGRLNSSKNQAEIGFYYAGGGSDSNRLDLGFHSSGSVMSMYPNGHVTIGMPSSYVPLFVQATTTISYGALGGTVYRLRTDYGVTESATGPINYSTSIFSNGYIGADALATTSDRRMKENIRELSFDYVRDFFKLVKPVSYTWREESNMASNMPEVGLISQDVLGAGYADLVSMNMKPGLQKSCDEDDDDVQLGLRYDRVPIYNMRMIQNLVERIDELEAKLAHLLDE